MIALQKKILYGPFEEVLTMSGLPIRGMLKDKDLLIERKAGILVDSDRVVKIGDWKVLLREAKSEKWTIIEMKDKSVAIPGLIDCHTHICYAGSRARDYALRNAGSSYLEIAAAGGGIMDTVSKVRGASLNELKGLTISRARELTLQGITTIEVKSGYGLTLSDEIKMLEAIKYARRFYDIIPTCLAAHIIPAEYKSNPSEYVNIITNELLPDIYSRGLTNRVDAFIEKEAYTQELITPYLLKAKTLGMDITLHVNQFTNGGVTIAQAYEAVSADHLEVMTDQEIDQISKTNVACVALPGASIGLGCAFTPARKILDAGGILAIASDYNPGSAPMGNLLTQASILGTFEKLSNAEVLAGITCRAAYALRRGDIGILKKGMIANIAIFNTESYQEILYQQGRLQPSIIILKGKIYE